MKRSVVRFAAATLLAFAAASCSKNATSPGSGIPLERVSGMLVERNTDQMSYDGPLVLVIAPIPSQRVNAVIPGSMRGDATPQERAVAQKAFQLPIGSHVIALGTRNTSGDLVVRELMGGL